MDKARRTDIIIILVLLVLAGVIAFSIGTKRSRQKKIITEQPAAEVTLKIITEKRSVS